MRKAIQRLFGGLMLYEVELVGGPANGRRSTCTHDTVYFNDQNGRHRYVRGKDDRYHYESPAGGKN